MVSLLFDESGYLQPAKEHTSAVNSIKTIIVN
jgi:hypothetical protein